MSDVVTLSLQDAESTRETGFSLSHSLYNLPVDIWFTGELGVGKTTFTQGFLEGLGVTQDVTSPTFALEQHYEGHTNRAIHIDLYRLAESQAKDLLLQSAEHDHIRIVEWADRIESTKPGGISLHLEETPNGRELTATFDDMRIPFDDDIAKIRKAAELPKHICDHCDKVADVAEKLTNALLERGVLVRKQAVIMAAKLHDIVRFVDFIDDTELIPLWQSIKDKYTDMNHERAGRAFLTEHGFKGIGTIVGTHSPVADPPETIEQKLLYYADKRVRYTDIVTIEQRFDDLVERYGHGEENPQAKKWRELTFSIEQELFAEGVPSL